tara:strand:+ start:452 stop:871 length:420 start_codon:yes stop_codon:yes gene_type:complete
MPGETMKKEDFYTLPKANAGVELPLKLANGDETGEWLRIRGAESDAFRAAKFQAARAIRDLPEDMEEFERAETVDSIMRDTVVSLVADWSFDEECTRDAVREFLTNAPHVAVDIDQIAADKTRFFENASSSSKRTRKRK